MVEKGTCLKHNREFVLSEGCPECLAEKQPLVNITTVEVSPESILGESTPNVAMIRVQPETNEAIIKLYDEAVKLQRYAEARIIKTVEDIKVATDDLSIISRLKKAIEEKRKEYVGPINDHLKAVNDAFKNFTEPLNQADRTTRQKILEYRREQDRIRAVQEEINRKRVEAAQEEMELKGELTESVELVEVIPEAPKRVSTDLGSAGMRDNWKYEVTDFSLLPDEYKVPDTAMLNSIAKKHHDTKQIPGVRFYNEPIIAVTAR